MALQFKIKPVKFADDTKGVEVSLGSKSVAYSYTDEADKKKKIEQAAYELMQMIQKPVTLKAVWGGGNVAHYGRGE